MPSKSTPTFTLHMLSDQIPNIFEQVQSSIANHQKNFISLSKLHSEAATVTEPVQDGINVQLTGEKVFEDVFIDMVLRTLSIKKGVAVGDRVARFIGGYVYFINTKGHENKEDEEDETMENRFIIRLIRLLLKGFESKDKNVRFRVLQLITEMAPSLRELPERLYDLLCTSLLPRIHDKEPIVRAQASIASSRLLGLADNINDQTGLLEAIMYSLICDPSAEVRKAILLNVPLDSVTLPVILSRTRDVDPSVRKSVYIPALEQLEHPKQLTIAQRELIVRAGIKDRDQNVSTAAETLVSSWIDKVNGDIFEFIKLFDFDLSQQDSSPAEQALLCVLKSRPEILGSLTFPGLLLSLFSKTYTSLNHSRDSFWLEMTPEKAFLSRVFVEHCILTKDDSRIESCMPVMTALAFRIQALYNDLLRFIQHKEEDQVFMSEDNERSDEVIGKLQFTLGELIKLACNMDYADEIGRRKMFALIRDMLCQGILPDDLVPPCLDILRILSASERDLIRIIVEIIHELRDSDTDDDDMRQTSVDSDMAIQDTPATIRVNTAPRKPVSEMTKEEKEQKDNVDLRCLSLCIGMLERVDSSFEENSTLEGILGELIIPAVKRKELAIREKGLVSLGLCCLIARRMALNSFQLFLQQIQSTPDPLKIRVLQIVFDNMMVHESDFLRNAGVGGDRVVQFLTKVFENEESQKVQAVLCIGLAKLMLSGMIADEKVLKSLVFAFMSPDTAENQEVRQCLSYFIPAYCYSSSANQRRMHQVFLSTYEEIVKTFNELDDDEEMISPLQAGSLFVDWTDPQKLMCRGQEVDHQIHFNLAIEISKKLFSDTLDNDGKKALCQLLGKLYIPDSVDDDKIRTLKLLVKNARSRRPLRDVASNNALTRFDNVISKKFEAQLEGFNEEEYRQLEYLKDLFEFLDDIIPEDDNEFEVSKHGSRKRNRRSESIVTISTATTVDEEEYGDSLAPRQRVKSKKQTKKRRVSATTSDSEQASKPVPTRTLPDRIARKNAKIVQEIPDSEDVDSEDTDDPSFDESKDEEMTPKSKEPRFRARNTRMRATNEQDLEDHNDLFASGYDPMVDSTIVDEEDGDASEVDDLLT